MREREWCVCERERGGGECESERERERQKQTDRQTDSKLLETTSLFGFSDTRKYCRLGRREILTRVQ